ncbi:MAG: hypothetical protein ABL886_03735 [Rhodoglobus sp.]
MAKKASKPGGTPASDKPSKLAYIVCRWWPYLAPEFPFDRFDHLPDEELPNALEQLRHEVVLQHRAAIESRRGPSPEQAASMGPSILYPRGRSRPDTLEARPPSLVEAFGAMRWVKHNVFNLEVTRAQKRPLLEPMPTAVVHATSEPRAHIVVDMLRSRCIPVEGQYRFAVVLRDSLPRPRWIQNERELDLLRVAKLPHVRSDNPLGPHLLMFGSTPEGVPHWTIPMRDEARAVEAILDREAGEIGEPGAERVHSKPAVGARKKMGGRPMQSDPDEDRRTFEAWDTRTHVDLEALATAFRTTKAKVKAALARHRTRVRRAVQSGEQTPVNKPTSKKNLGR